MYKIDNKKSTICRRFFQKGYKGSQEMHSMLLKKNILYRNCLEEVYNKKIAVWFEDKITENVKFFKTEHVKVKPLAATLQLLIMTLMLVPGTY